MRRIERLFIEKSAAVQAFFRRRLRSGSAAETMDLTQEVYSRILDASRLRPIRDPEAYLFTVARHLLEEHAVASRRRATNVQLSDPQAREWLQVEDTVERDADCGRIAELLGARLHRLSAPCRAALVLAYEEGLSYREIAERLGVSKPMVQKYLAQAISYCRQHLFSTSGRKTRGEAGRP